MKRVLELTDGKGVDAMHDAVGKDTYVSVRSRVSPTLARIQFTWLDSFEGDLKMIKKRGIIVVFGTTSGPLPLFDLGRFMEKNIKFTYTT